MRHARPRRCRIPGVQPRAGGRMRVASALAPSRLPRTRLMLRWRRPRAALRAAGTSTHIHPLTLNLAYRLHVVLNIATDMRLLVQRLAAAHGSVATAQSASRANAADVRARHDRRFAGLALTRAAVGRFFAADRGPSTTDRSGVRGRDETAIPRLRPSNRECLVQGRIDRSRLQCSGLSELPTQRRRTAGSVGTAGFPPRLLRRVAPISPAADEAAFHGVRPSRRVGLPARVHRRGETALLSGDARASRTPGDDRARLLLQIGLVWREAPDPGERQTPSATHARVRVAQAREDNAALAAPAGGPPAAPSIVHRNVTLDSAGMNRLAREVFGRIEQKLRIERERRGY